MNVTELRVKQSCWKICNQCQNCNVIICWITDTFSEPTWYLITQVRGYSPQAGERQHNKINITQESLDIFLFITDVRKGWSWQAGYTGEVKERQVWVGEAVRCMNGKSVRVYPTAEGPNSWVSAHSQTFIPWRTDIHISALYRSFPVHSKSFRVKLNLLVSEEILSDPKKRARKANFL